MGHDGQGRALPGTGRPGPVEPGAHGRDRASDGMMRRLERADSSNAEPVDPVIGTPHLGQSIVECEKLIGARSAKGIMASGRVSRIHRPNTWLPRPALLLQRSLTTRSRSLIAAQDASAIFLDRHVSFVRPRRRLSSAPTAKRECQRAQTLSRLAALMRPPSGLALIVSSTLDMLGMSGLMRTSLHWPWWGKIRASSTVDMRSASVDTRGHGSLRGRQVPPQHQIRSAVTAMSTTGSRSSSAAQRLPSQLPASRV
jgi:hypothetical protein